MGNPKEKKSILERLTGGHQKEKKSSCCCNFRIEEIPEEPADSERIADSPKAKNNCCHES